MDYLQTLEYRMAALQRKIRLLQDLLYFAETATPEELAAFGDELRAVATSSGASLGSILAGMLGPGGRAAPSPNAARAGETMPAAAAMPAAVPAVPSAAGRAPGAAAAPEPAPASVLDGGAKQAAPEFAASAEREEALALVSASMKRIPAGSFVMGSENGDTSEKPPHAVRLASFMLCDHLVTNKEYSLFIRANPSWSKDRANSGLVDGHYLEDWTGDSPPEGKEDNPVAFVPYAAAAAFAAWLGMRLPTEAQWEYAARGGLVGKKFPNGDQMNDTVANLAKQFKGTTPVRKFPPNGFGLYDMAGNLFEWCADWYGPYSPGEAADPEGPSEGEYKVVRGGSWMSGAGALRTSARVDMETRTCGQIGIRLASGA